MVAQKNKSERLFERYLNLRFKDCWSFEPHFSGKSKRPDYVLNFGNDTFLFEVKEFREKSDKPEKASYICPYRSLRLKIAEATKKFKEFKDYSCSLVVYNIDDWTVRLRPDFVFGAMLGNLGITMDFDAEEGIGKIESVRNAFLDGGKMLDNGRFQNTTINSIIALEVFCDNSEVNKAVDDEVSKIDRQLDNIEKLEIRLKIYEDHHIKRFLRVVVYENPFARIKLNKQLFRGSYDERWCFEDNKFNQIYVGDNLKDT